MPADQPDRRRRTALSIDLDLVVTDWFVDELFGLSPEDVLGRFYSDLISTDAQRATRLQVLQETGRFEGIVVVADEHNEHVAVRAVAEPIWRDGRVAGWRVELREAFAPGYFPDV
jgi:PAS domain-containing protein